MCQKASFRRTNKELFRLVQKSNLFLGSRLEPRQDLRSAVPRLFHAFFAISLVFQLADARQHESQETWVPSQTRSVRRPTAMLLVHVQLYLVSGTVPGIPGTPLVTQEKQNVDHNEAEVEMKTTPPSLPTFCNALLLDGIVNIVKTLRSRRFFP
jgi:hypothetical protein